MRCWSTNGLDGAGIVEVAGGGRGGARLRASRKTETHVDNEKRLVDRVSGVGDGVVVGSGVAEALAVVSTAERSDVGVVHGREAMWA